MRRRAQTTPAAGHQVLITQYHIAKAINVPARRISEIVHGKRAITADTPCFASCPGLWDCWTCSGLPMQAQCDVEIACDYLAARLDAIDNVAPDATFEYETEVSRP